MLIPVHLLVNGSTIRQEPVAQVTYCHVELASHDVLLAEGLAVESYVDTGNRGMFANAPLVQLHADPTATASVDLACPMIFAGPMLDRARAELAAAQPASRTGRAA